MDIKEFLLARIAEDEAGADTFHEKYCGWCLHEGPGFNEDGCICGHPQKILRECAAKRAIIADRERIDRSASDSDWSMGYSDANYDALQAVAAIYSDHPDCSSEWVA